MNLKTDRKEAISFLGRIGEVMFGNYMSAAGKCVLYSEDPFDSSKDLIIDSEIYEVKTQVPYVSENAFTIKMDQVRKCKDVDHLVFLSVPCDGRSHHSFGKVYMVRGSKSRMRSKKMPDGRHMVLLPIEHMEEVFTLTQEQCDILRKYSVSGL